MFPGPKSKEIFTYSSMEPICFLTLDGTIAKSHLLARENIWLPVQGRIGNLIQSCFLSFLLWATTIPARFWRNLEGVGVQKDCVKMPHHLCCTMPTLKILGLWIYKVFSALQTAHALIFFTAETTSDFFRDQIQGCAHKYVTISSSKKREKSVDFVAFPNFPDINTPHGLFQYTNMSWEEMYSSTEPHILPKYEYNR